MTRWETATGARRRTSADEWTVRLNRGVRSALIIGLGASLFAAAKNVLVVVALFYLSPFIAILAALFGATHAFLLHALPKRGPLNSVLLGASLGALLGFSAVLREFATLAGWALLGALHGTVIGLRERRVAAARTR